mmetsp:Transcript_15579/g.36092  ORF Transcript_15579/g.36092 Transcript_15579/m.36092 type:complete len:89 (-) Transcript_15579:2031-2297(-)
MHTSAILTHTGLGVTTVNYGNGARPLVVQRTRFEQHNTHTSTHLERPLQAIKNLLSVLEGLAICVLNLVVPKKVRALVDGTALIWFLQ